jgi:hypothetical protein
VERAILVEEIGKAYGILLEILEKRGPLGIPRLGIFT